MIEREQMTRSKDEIHSSRTASFFGLRIAPKEDCLYMAFPPSHFFKSNNVIVYMFQTYIMQLYL